MTVTLPRSVPGLWCQPHLVSVDESKSETEPGFSRPCYLISTTLATALGIKVIIYLSSKESLRYTVTVKALLHYAWSYWRFISLRLFHFTSRFTLRFSSRFRYQHVSIQNASENARKMQEKRKKKSKTRENVSILHYALGKNASQLRFARVLLAFCSHFARILLTNFTKMQTQRIV